MLLAVIEKVDPDRSLMGFLLLRCTVQTQYFPCNLVEGNSFFQIKTEEKEFALATYLVTVIFKLSSHLHT